MTTVWRTLEAGRPRAVDYPTKEVDERERKLTKGFIAPGARTNSTSEHQKADWQPTYHRIPSPFEGGMRTA
jgi:hypothetical protein